MSLSVSEGGLFMSQYGKLKANHAVDPLDQIPVQSLTVKTIDGNKVNFENAPQQVGTLGKMLRNLSSNAIVIEADGAHRSPETNYLAGHIAHTLALKGKPIRTYVEVSQQKGGTARIDPAFLASIRKLPGTFSTDLQSKMSFLQHVVDIPNAKVFGVDGCEGNPLYDGGIIQMGKDAYERYSRARDAFQEKYALDPRDPKAQLDPNGRYNLIEWSENWDQYGQKFGDIVKGYAKNIQEYQAFMKSFHNEITYQLRPDWDPGRQVSYSLRQKQDNRVADRIAQQEKGQKGPAFIFYGAGHMRNSPESLAAQLHQKMPNRPVFMLNAVKDIQQVAEMASGGVSPSAIGQKSLYVFVPQGGILPLKTNTKTQNRTDLSQGGTGLNSLAPM